MWEQIFNLAISNGLFAVMFVGLFIYQLKDSKTREIKYQKTIENLGNALETLKEVKEDVEEIKDKLNSENVCIKINKEVKDEGKN